MAVDGFGIPLSPPPKKTRSVDLSSSFANRIPEREFIPNEVEWSAKNRKQIILSERQLVTGTDKFYTVPKNKVFFLTCATLTTVNNNGIDECVGSLRVKNEAGTDFYDIMIHVIEDVRNCLANAITFPMPLRLEEGQSVNLILELDTGTAGDTFCFISGWEEDKPLN